MYFLRFISDAAPTNLKWASMAAFAFPPNGPIMVVLFGMLANCYRILQYVFVWLDFKSFFLFCLGCVCGMSMLNIEWNTQNV